MQAGHRDFRVATDTDTSFAFRIHEAGGPVEAGTINEGDWVHYRRRPWQVWSITVNGSQLTWQLGNGLWTDPQVKLLDTALVATSEPLVIQSVSAALMPDPAIIDPPDTMEIPSSLTDGNTVISLDFTSTWLETIQAWIDYLGAGPSGFAAPYDVIATIDGDRRRVLQGTLTFIRSTASRPVANPLEVTP